MFKPALQSALIFPLPLPQIHSTMFKYTSTGKAQLLCKKGQDDNVFPNLLKYAPRLYIQSTWSSPVFCISREYNAS